MLNSSQLVQRVAINEIAECITAFSTNYKDTGLFGVYAVAKVRSPQGLLVSLKRHFTRFDVGLIRLHAD